MRIIGGQFRGRRFTIPGNFKARPTTDFAKENIFNLIGNLIDLTDSTALDLFSGTGSLGFELVSRGCKQVVCVEKDRFHHAFICKVRDELKIAKSILPIKRDVFTFLVTCKETYDIIVADPPYALKELATIPSLILSKRLLNPGGIFVMEHSKEYDFADLPFFLQRRVYGAVNFSIFLYHSD